ncbi:unnamed protein product [Mycena citricolor]|uniref:F-box domain-containing protein n=1 Tax=Mycena citricolor TaxID=2018698 RepID=A0AAD2HJH0_9AGAR|nr:unnamed protein product [Mycena citricolor]CAK5276480.1 unnamed protein product [Mycena citricolor]
MPPHLRLPPELWASVFEELERSDLLSANLLSWPFHALTHPLVFRTIHFGFTSWKESTLLPRLAGLQRGDIAPYVQKVDIHFVNSLLVQSHRSTLVVSPDSGNPLVVALLRTLRSFCGLRQLFMRLDMQDAQIDIARLGLEQIGVKELLIWGGRVVPPTLDSADTSMICLERLHLRVRDPRDKESSAAAAHLCLPSHLSLLDMLDPSRLRALELYFDSQVVLGSGIRRLRFLAVTSLRIECRWNSPRVLEDLAHMFPNVQQLVLSGSVVWFRDSNDTRWALFSGLESLHVPEACLPLLLCARRAGDDGLPRPVRLVVSSECRTFQKMMETLDMRSLQFLRLTIKAKAFCSAPFDVQERLPSLTTLQLSISLEHFRIDRDSMRQIACALARMIRPAKALLLADITLVDRPLATDNSVTAWAEQQLIAATKSLNSFLDSRFPDLRCRMRLQCRLRHSLDR